MVERLKSAIEKARTQRPTETSSDGESAARLPVRVSPLWETLPVQRPDRRSLEDARVIAGARGQGNESELDVMQTRLLRLIDENGWRRVAVTATGPGCGATTIALNLAFALSRSREQRVLLVDPGLREPSLIRRLGLRTDRLSTSGSDETDTPAMDLRRIGESLALLAVEPSWGRPGVSNQVAELSDEIDRVQQELSANIVLFNLPPVALSSEALVMLGRIDAALQVAGANRSTASEIDACARLIDETTTYLGVVLNNVKTRRRAPIARTHA
ncbi:MAG: hypothetical protein AAF479_08755 [Pseudomonadota bacterium]